jgi:ABC-type phosphate/phosphonate transport system substrate-binding protein
LHDIWTDPDLLLAQTCGYPLVTSLAGRVALVATPRYAAFGCAGAYYRSAVVVRGNDTAAGLADLRGRRCAVNDAASNSGMNMFRAAIATVAAGDSRFFNEVVMTGGHVASVQAVVAGQADAAAIDCVTWAQLQRLRPAATRRLRVLAWTAASPGLPLITSLRTPAATLSVLLTVLGEVLADRALAPVRDALLLEGFDVLKPADYDAAMAFELLAQDARYPILR